MIQTWWWSRLDDDPDLMMIQQWWSRSSDDLDLIMIQWCSRSSDDPNSMMIQWWSRSSDDPDLMKMTWRWRWLDDEDDLKVNITWIWRWRWIDDDPDDTEKKTCAYKLCRENTFLVKRECWCICNFRMYSLVYLKYCTLMFILGSICSVIESCHTSMFISGESIM